MEESAQLPDYVFRRHGQVWHVRYRGGHGFILLPSKGAAYIHTLLSNSGTTFTALELYHLVAKEPAQYALADSSGGSDTEDFLRSIGSRISAGAGVEVLDNKAITAYKRKLSDLYELKETAEESGDWDSVERHQEEIDALEQQLQQGLGLSGRKRRMGDDSERCRVAVCNAITRAVKEIEKWHKALGSHLRNSLKLGTSLSYTPETPIDWTTE